MLTLATLFGCRLETEVVPETQVVVDVDADSIVRELTHELDIRVSTAASYDARDELKLVRQRRYVRGSGGDVEQPLFPVQFVLKPSDGDPRRVFEVYASSFAADGRFLSEVRIQSGYVAHEMRHAWVTLSSGCTRIACGSAETCRAGACESAWRKPARLPVLGSRADKPESPPPFPADASPEPDAALDAGPPDSGADAGPVDAGPPPAQCVDDNGGCDPLVACTDGPGGARCGACPNGYWDELGDGTRCTDIDECQIDNGGCDRAHGVCTNKPGAHACACEKGYFGDGRECSLNVPCLDDPKACNALASCSDWMGKRLCVCGPGYEGDGAQCKDIDECAHGTARCMQNGRCVNNEGSFSCACNPGYLLKQGECVDIDECAANSDDCDDTPQACVNELGSFQCKCPAGYTGSGVGAEGCVDIDECAPAAGSAASCGPNAACSNTAGSFKCACKSGYSGDGTTCVDLDECELATDNCSSEARCTNTDGGFTCRCRRGFSGDGKTCSDIDECRENTDDCGANALCANNDGGYTCRCNPGFSGDGKTCTATSGSN